MNRRMAAVCLLLLIPGLSLAQENELWRSWNQPVEPFQVIGNIYYVGASDVTAFLITTPEGHIVLDGGFPETAPMILANIETLGFAVEDVALLLNSHAHFDHSGGLAALKAATGARLLISEGDADLVENGGRGDFLMGDDAPFPAVEVDERFSDGKVVEHGGVSLTAHVTPGHTQGCTTWTMQVEDQGQTHDVVFACSVSVLPQVRLTTDPSYPGIADDFQRTFAVLKALPCDVFLSGHGMFFALKDKIEARTSNPETNPFIDPDRYRAWVARGEARFLERLANEEKQ